MDTIIKVENLSFRYNKQVRAIQDLSLTVNRGEWISILGHNGSGKSTFSKLLIGLLKAQSGTIEIDGELLRPESVQSIRHKVGIVFQNPDNQFVGVTVKDDIAFGLENLQIERQEMLNRIQTYAEKVGMHDYLEKEPSALSGGQKQRVAIAGILAMQPKIIIFDEATSMLDPKGRDMMIATMKQLNDEGTTILTITHDLKETVHSDRILVLKEGQTLAFGPPEEILTNEALLLEARLELLKPLALASALKRQGTLDEGMASFLWALNLTM